MEAPYLIPLAIAPGPVPPEADQHEAFVHAIKIPAEFGEERAVPLFENRADIEYFFDRYRHLWEELPPDESGAAREPYAMPTTLVELAMLGPYPPDLVVVGSRHPSAGPVLGELIDGELFHQDMYKLIYDKLFHARIADASDGYPKIVLPEGSRGS